MYTIGDNQNQSRRTFFKEKLSTFVEKWLLMPKYLEAGYAP